MATTTLTLPNDGTWTEIMPISTSAYCIVMSATEQVKFKQAATQPAPGDDGFAVASKGDQINGAASEPMWAAPLGQKSPVTVVRFDG